jgi:hypothetical protein
MTETPAPPIQTARVQMPAVIAAAVISIKRGLEHATRTATAEDGGSYASADDVYAACQKEMAGAGILIEMLDEGFEFVELPGEDGTMRAHVHMQFLPVITHESGTSYENPRSIIHMVGPYESMSTCSALRTLAEKTYMRSLFKLPSAPGAASSASAEGEGGERRSYSAPAVSESGTKPASGKTKIVNPLMKGKHESAEMRETIIAEMEAAAKVDGDPAKRIAAVNAAFRNRQSDYARLTPADGSEVKKRNAVLMTEISTAGAAA